MLLEEKLYGDQGYVKLLDVIPSSIPDGFSSRDAYIANSAKISTQADPFKNNFEVYDFIEKLLVKWHHYTPFEKAVMEFEIKAPYVAWHQLDRHRTFLYSSHLRRSGRYTSFDYEDFYVPEYFTDSQKETLSQMIYRGLEYYDWFVETGDLKKESARFFLPAFCLMYTDKMTVDLKNLLHFLALRTDKHAQIEIREMANAMMTLTGNLFPYTIKIFNENIKPLNYDLQEIS